MIKKFIFIGLVLQCFFSFSMEHNPTINQTEDYGQRYPLHQAVKNGRLEGVRRIILEQPEQINICDDAGKSPLYFACYNKKYVLINFLLLHGADKTNLSDVAFLSKPQFSEVKELLNLEQVTSKSHLRILNKKLANLIETKQILNAYLLMKRFPELGKDLEIDWTTQDELGRNILFHAVEHQNRRLLNRFIELGLDINSVDKYGKPLLFYAIETGSIPFVEMLLAKNVTLNVLDTKGNSALNAVNSKLSSPQMIKFLIDHGVKPDINLILSTLLEIPARELNQIVKKAYSEVLCDGNRINSDELKNLLESENCTAFLREVVKIFTKKNNYTAVESLLLILQAQDRDVFDFLSDYIEFSDFDETKMLQIFVDYTHDKNNILFLKVFSLCVKYNKYECLKMTRMLAHFHHIDLSECIDEWVKNKQLKFELLEKEHLNRQEDFTVQLMNGLKARRIASNRARNNPFTTNDERLINSAKSKDLQSFEIIKNRFINLKNACYCPLRILLDKASTDSVNTSDAMYQVQSINAAIDSNNPELFINYIYQDQSEGRGSYISIQPKLEHLVYAISLNPDSEVVKLQLIDPGYTKELYVTNLCEIIDSILAISEDQIIPAMTKQDSQGETIIHQAAFYACPEVLNHLLTQLNRICSPQQFNTIINSRNTKKGKRSPLELALLRGSEQNVELLIHFGADITLLNPKNLASIQAQANSLIGQLVRNRQVLNNLNNTFGSHITTGLTSGEVCGLFTNYHAQQNRLKVAFAKKKHRREVAIMVSGAAVVALAAYKFIFSERILKGATLSVYR